MCERLEPWLSGPGFLLKSVTEPSGWCLSVAERMRPPRCAPTSRSTRWREHSVIARLTSRWLITAIKARSVHSTGRRNTCGRLGTQERIECFGRCAPAEYEAACYVALASAVADAGLR